MGAIASLSSKLIAVTPGAEASVEIKVRNNGSVVDQLTLSVLGDAADWSRAEPSELSLFPGAEGTATIAFAPPRRSTVSAGEMPFGVRVASGEDPDGSVVEEGRLDVAAFSEVGAELQPQTSRGSRGARHDLAVDNRGNVLLNATISGLDSNEDLAFDIKPPSVVAEPGQASFSEVAVKPTKRIWHGQPKSQSFTVQVEAADQPPIPVSGTFLQEAMLPGWLIKALIALAAVIIALLFIWFFLLEPTLLSAAEDRAKAAAQEAIEEAGLMPDPGAGGAGGPASPSPSSTPMPAPEPEPTAATLLPEGDPVAGRITASGEGTAAPPIPDGKIRYITDLVFSNPAGESGDVQLRRDSQVLLALKLENFRDLDFHFVTPIVFEEGDRMDLSCRSCSEAAVFYSGYER